MADWWSYGLSDFLMFSPRVYWRMVEAYNLAFWPAPLAALAAGAAAIVLAWRGGRPGARAALLVLALAWAWVAWAFFRARYAQIFLAAPAMATIWALQALALALAAAMPLAGATGALRRTGLGLATLGLAAWPWLAPVFGRPWTQAEVFGWMPDPTALVTLGLLMALPLGRWRWALMLVPLLSLGTGALTRAAMAQ
jgi:hypothetical protein